MKKWIIFSLLLVSYLSCARRDTIIIPENKGFYQNKVNTIFFKGKVTINGPKDDIEGSIFVVAQKHPFNIKIEITNWLSGPILYVFIRDKMAWIISPKERKVYIGTLKDINNIYNIFPPVFNQQQIWSIIRAIPERANTSSNRLKISYSDYDSYNGIVFAKKINIYSFYTRILWKLNIKEIHFNKIIPAQVFDIKIPKDFKVLRYQAPSS